ncbi:MAG: MauE/DoxX family redox-associated membrane protein [Parvularculaceae bacterium]
MLIDPALSLAAALPLTGLLAASAAHQARDLRRFAAAVEAYKLLPPGAGVVAAPILIIAQAAAAAGLLAPSCRFEAGLLAAALFTAYGAAIAFNLALGRRDIECGCVFGRAGEGLSAGQVWRNAALVSFALVAAAPTASRALGPFDFVSVGLFAAAAAALYAGFEAILGNAARARATRSTP